MRQQLLDMLASSTIVQAIVTLLLVATDCYMWANGKPVPAELLATTGVVMGFWFGTKSQQLAARVSSQSAKHL